MILLDLWQLFDDYKFSFDDVISINNFAITSENSDDRKINFRKSLCQAGPTVGTISVMLRLNNRNIVPVIDGDEAKIISEKSTTPNI